MADILLQGKRGLYLGLTGEQLRVMLDEAKFAFRDVAREHVQARELRAVHGNGVLKFRSAESGDSLRGDTANAIFIDEAAFIPEKLWTKILRPMLSSTNGDAMFATTPNGRGWFHKMFETAKITPRRDTLAVNAPTLGVEITDDGKLIRKPHPLENDCMPFEEILQVFETTPLLDFRQEFLAEASDNVYGVFRNVLDCVEVVSPPDPRVVCIGLDYARTTDATVAAVLDIETKRFVEVIRFVGLPYLEQIEVIAQVFARYSHCEVVSVGEANAMGGMMNETLRSRGFPVTDFYTTAQSKPDLIGSLALAFDRMDVTIPYDAWLVDEFEAYERKATGTGITFSAPSGKHDDGVMACALAWLAVSAAQQPTGLLYNDDITNYVHVSRY